MAGGAQSRASVAPAWGYAQARICRLAAGESLILPGGLWHRLVLLSGQIEAPVPGCAQPRNLSALNGEAAPPLDLGPDGARLVALSDVQLALYSAEKRMG